MSAENIPIEQIFNSDENGQTVPGPRWNAYTKQFRQPHRTLQPMGQRVRFAIVTELGRNPSNETVIRKAAEPFIAGFQPPLNSHELAQFEAGLYGRVAASGVAKAMGGRA